MSAADESAKPLLHLSEGHAAHNNASNEHGEHPSKCALTLRLIVTILLSVAVCSQKLGEAYVASVQEASPPFLNGATYWTMTGNCNGVGGTCRNTYGGEGNLSCHGLVGCATDICNVTLRDPSELTMVGVLLAGSAYGRQCTPASAFGKRLEEDAAFLATFVLVVVAWFLLLLSLGFGLLLNYTEGWRRGSETSHKLFTASWYTLYGLAKACALGAYVAAGVTTHEALPIAGAIFGLWLPLLIFLGESGWAGVEIKHVFARPKPGAAH